MDVYCSKQHTNNESNRFCTQCGEPLPLRIGQVVDNRYRIIRHLGQGGFGRTYVAEDLNQSQLQCVLKEFAPQVEEQQDLEKAKELFEREASVLKKLQHPQIPRFHASLQVTMNNKDFFFLVQDYVDGDNYWDLLEKRTTQGQTFSEEEVVELLKMMLPVLAYIHSFNVVHRDLSPDNIILRHSDHLPVLIDFGGVKQLPASKGFWFTQLGGIRTILGKKGYAPEEQLRQGKAFPSSDLYSIAVTSLVLLTGQEPQRLYDSYQGSWRWGEEIKVSPKTEAVLKKMLAYKPSDRYQKADDVLKDLQSNTPTVNPAKTVNPANTANLAKTAKPTIKPIKTAMTKLKTMVVAPGGKRVKTLVGKFHNKTQMVAQALPLPVWLRPFAVSLISTSVIVLTLAGTWAVVSAVIHAVSSISIPTISLPKNPEGSDSPKKPTASNEPNRGNQIIRRRQQLEIPEVFFTQMTDNIFYTKNPDAKGRVLTSNSEDTALRNEWFAIANDLLNKLERANLSTSARRKLGNYSARDYDNWRRQAQAGEFGEYTIEQLNKDTNKKFDRLFPGRRRENEKLDKQTLGQIWYALAADQISKLESAN
ncbi:serine/threonine-protein kinase [Brasilonema sp. UFV-L1]|uniref:serine/threonine-protein kinase n=1 Tax=Brasilonema sp. UFV-L1 TaxID=2234130 RepID=UPI00145D0170|nr:serine/threonine-protein kinase [Brasilonema sp. UFV-L1]NMG11567.1 serine/threonine protein kinase [Brasilonema sp. UFV-L1]